MIDVKTQTERESWEEVMEREREVDDILNWMECLSPFSNSFM